MARSIGRRFLDFLWGPAEEMPSEGYDDYGAERGMGAEDDFGLPTEEPLRTSPRRARHAPRQEEVVELRPPRQPRTEVHYPRSFDDALPLADLYKQGICLIVDLEQVDDKERSHLVNFLSGVAYGRDGNSKKINPQTFVFAPRHFELESEKLGRSNADPGFVPRFQMNA